MTAFIETMTDGPVATVSLNRPDVHNAFNDSMIDQLDNTFYQLGQDPATRVIVLRSEGQSFCAGADLHWMSSMLDYTFDENVEDAKRLFAMLRTINTCPKPIIGRVHGAAFGGGVGLISVCDMVVAVERASFCLSEVKLGLLPAVISPFVMRRMTASAARRYFLTAERFKAPEALGLGLIHAVVQDEPALDAQVQAWVDLLVANAPVALRECKQLIADVDGLDFDSALYLTTRRIAERRVSEEGQEGMQAFLGKRTPAWMK